LSTLTFFFLLTLLPPPLSTLFPYTTLFRSLGALLDQRLDVVGGQHARARYDLALAFGLERGELEVDELGQAAVEQADRHRPGVRSEEHTLNSSHRTISYAVFCLKKKKNDSY